MKKEIEILCTVEHPNIIKYFETFEDRRYFHIIMEFCNGGELIDRIIEKGNFSEAEAARLMY